MTAARTAAAAPRLTADKRNRCGMRMFKERTRSYRHKEFASAWFTDKLRCVGTNGGRRTVEEMRRAPCVVSVAEHTGWAHLVCIAAPGLVPAVIERRRVTLIDSGVPRQPYEHDSTAMREDEANALIAQVRRSIAARTSEALTRVVTELARSYAVVALAIRKPPFARPARNGRCCADIVSAAMRRGRDAVSAGHLSRGSAARA